MKLLRTEYQTENNKPIIYMFTRDDKGQRKIIIDDSFVPYFYVPITEENNLSGIRKDPTTYYTTDDTPVRKIYATLPSDVPKLRESFTRSFEADILFNTRYQIDCVDEIEPTIPMTIFLDIETDNSGRVPSPKLAPEPIICVSVHDNLSDIYSTFIWRNDLSPGTHSEIFSDILHEIHYFKSEEDMLKALIDFIGNEGPDIISGWNCNRFDLLYLINRLTRLNIPYRKLSPMNSVYLRDDGEEVVIKGMALIDLYDAYRKFEFSQEESYTLDFIAKKVTGQGKIESSSNIKWLWKNDLDRLIKYNVNDVKITKGINDKLRLLEFLDELRRISFCQFEDTFSASRTSDSYILRLFHNKKIFPTKQHHKRTKFEGAYVGSWARGIYNDVAVFDIRSLYPNIVCSFNLSPETVISEAESHFGDNIKVNNIWVKTDKKGFLTEVIENLFKERARYKVLQKNEEINSDQWKLYDSRQYALKTLLNALYGQTAYPNSRIYDPRIAETVTYLGRQIINWSKDFLENIGYKVLYCDTDSLFVQMDENIDQIKYILTLLNNSYTEFTQKFGITKHQFEMEFEKVYRKAFFGRAKKRYCGHVIYKDEKKVDFTETMGFEIRRSDSSQFSRKLQRTVFDMLLRQDKSKDEVTRHIGSEIDRIRKGSFIFTEIGIPQGISKDLDKYGKKELIAGKIVEKGVQAHIRGARYAVSKLNIELSSKPKMIYISKMPNKHEPTDVLCFDEDNQVPPGTEIDVEKMLEKIVKNKLEPIFEALGWRMSELVYHWRGRAPQEGTQEELNLVF